MFAMICTDNLRYKKTKYYDSEYVIKGTLHINEHAYAFSHYDGAFEVLGIRWLSNYTKGRYSKDTGLEFSFGADTEEGRLLQEHKDEAIECILQTVHAYKLTNIDAWVEYFNFAVSCTGTYQYSVTRCQAFPDERFRCTIKTPSPDCVLTYSFNFDEEEFPRLETPYFPGVELLETDIDKEFIMSPGISLAMRVCADTFFAPISMRSMLLGFAVSNFSARLSSYRRRASRMVSTSNCFVGPRS